MIIFFVKSPCEVYWMYSAVALRVLMVKWWVNLNWTNLTNKRLNWWGCDVNEGDKESVFHQILLRMKYDPNEPEAWPNTKNEVRMSEVASWLSAISDVFGACIRARFPMYPTLDPSRTMRAMKTVSESKMTEGRKGAITNSYGVTSQRLVLWHLI